MPTLPFDIPDGYEILVKEGDKVTAGQILAKSERNVEEIVNIPEHLGVSLKNAGKYIKKEPGEVIEPGEIIAIKKNFFGKTQEMIVSEIAGTISRYERDTGNLVIRNDERMDEGSIISPVEGVVQLCNNKEIVVRTEKAIGGTRVVSGTKGKGELFVLEESFNHSGTGNMLFYLDSRAAGKIVLGMTFSRDVLIKGVGIGAAGFLAQSIADDDIAYLRERNISMPVMEIGKDSVELLKKKNGQKILLDTQSRTVIFV